MAAWPSLLVAAQGQRDERGRLTVTGRTFKLAIGSTLPTSVKVGANLWPPLT